MKNDDKNNSNITPDSSDALDILVDVIKKTDPNDEDFNKNNYEIYEKYAELIYGSSLYKTEDKKIKKKTLAPYRKMNQLNVEDLSKYADNLNRARDFLEDEK